MAKSKQTPASKKASRPSKKVASSAARPAKPARSASSAAEALVTVDRRAAGERRKKGERRQVDIPVAVERRKLERRTKVSRRRQIDPTTCERDYSLEEIEFMNALDDYKRSSGRMFPTCSEILEVFRKLGYVKQSTEPVTAEVPPVVAETVATLELPSAEGLAV